MFWKLNLIQYYLKRLLKITLKKNYLYEGTSLTTPLVLLYKLYVTINCLLFNLDVKWNYDNS